MGPAIAAIVATLGPSSLPIAPALASAGANALRLNASHMQPHELGRAVAAVRACLDQRVVVDLQGAKMRVGDLAPKRLATGDVVRFAAVPDDDQTIPLDHPELFRSLRQGDTLSLDDDRIRMRVVAVGDGAAEAVCLTDGLLRPRKGINVLDHPVELGDLSARDLAHIDAVSGVDGIDFAFSFMLDGREAAWIKRRAPRARVIGKIERREATERIEAIGAACDELWVCRGDLGAQLGAARLAKWVSSFRPATGGIPVLMAGQVLEHLTRHADPTRSEVCHLFDLIDRGYAGIVLSDETAIGDDPVRAVRVARGLVDEMRG